MTLAFGLFLIWLVIKLSSVLLLVFLALMLTAALDPFVTRMERRGWKRSSAVTALLVGLLVIVAGILVLTVPAMIRDGQQLAPSDLPTYVERLRPYFKNHPESTPGCRMSLPSGPRIPAFTSPMRVPWVKPLVRF